MAVEHWTIEFADGEWEVRKGRRRQRIATDLVAAIRWIRKRREPNEKVYVVEDDGYRLDITRRHFSQTRD